MRNRTLPILLALCTILVLAAGPAPAARADEGAQAPAAAPAELALPAAAPAAQPALACPTSSLVEPLFLASPSQTCEECQARCDAKSDQCLAHCHDRLCIDNCFDRFSVCLAGCPC